MSQRRGKDGDKEPARERGTYLGYDSKPTLRTVAELTGLAVTTVSRALSDAPQIAL
ncbi:MAG: LacI family transcriptional regulator, partial [Pseudorhizobium sp.]